MTQIIGSLRRIDEFRGAVRVEDTYNTGIDDLWSALTEPDRLARWIARVDGDLRPGGTSTPCSPAPGRDLVASTYVQRRTAWW